MGAELQLQEQRGRTSLDAPRASWQTDPGLLTGAGGPCPLTRTLLLVLPLPPASPLSYACRLALSLGHADTTTAFSLTHLHPGSEHLCFLKGHGRIPACLPERSKIRASGLLPVHLPLIRDSTPGSCLT